MLVRLLRGLCAFAVVIALSACGTFKLGEDYDPKIEDGLYSYFQQTGGFLREMQDLGKDDPRALYDANRDFYARSGAGLDTLLLRARLADTSKSCPSVKGKGADTAMAVVTQLLPEADAKAFEAQAAKRPAGNCTVQILYSLKANHDLLSAVHRSSGSLNPMVAGMLKDTIEQGVRIAIAAETAKK